MDGVKPVGSAMSANIEEAVDPGGQDPDLLQSPFRRLMGGMDKVLQAVLVLALLGELGIVFANVLNRVVLGRSLLWTLEAAEMALAAIAFVGGALAYRRCEHAFVRSLVDRLPLGYQRTCYALVEMLVLGVAIITALSAIPLVFAQQGELTPVLQIPVGWFVLPLVVSMVVLGMTAIERLLGQHRRTVYLVGTAVGLLLLLLVLTRDEWRPWVVGDASLGLSLACFFVPVLVGLPVGFALMLGATAYLYAADTVPMAALAHTMVNGVGNFVLLALPFFILAARIMNQGGISLRLVHLVQTLVGHFRGGLLQVMVVSMYVVSGLSGSKSADVAAVGLVMRDMLRREGYSLEQSSAVLAASAAMGETVPPSIAMLVLGSVTTLSIGALFIAGLIPAAVIAVCLMILIYFQARRAQIPRLPRASLKQIFAASLAGVLPLLMPVILFGGILFGLATPTEVSSFAVIYGLILAGLIYRELGVRAFVQGVIDCALISGMILFIMGTAASFSWTLNIASLPQRLVEILSTINNSHVLFMLASMVLLIAAGSILEGLPALVILGPILLPIATQVGVSQLHYGIVLVIAMGIGAFMPPVGVGFYVCCAIMGTSIERSARAMIPYVIVLCLGLLVVALVPWFTLYLPLAFHLGG